GLVAQGNAADLLGRHLSVVENVQAPVCRVRQPNLLFVRRQADAVAGTAVAFSWALLESFHRYPMEHLAALQIADFKTEQSVYVHIAESLAAIDREWPDHVAEGANFANDLVRSCVRDAQDGRFQPGQVGGP